MGLELQKYLGEFSDWQLQQSRFGQIKDTAENVQQFEKLVEKVNDFVWDPDKYQELPLYVGSLKTQFDSFLESHNNFIGFIEPQLAENLQEVYGFELPKYFDKLNPEAKYAWLRAQAQNLIDAPNADKITAWKNNLDSFLLKNPVFLEKIAQDKEFLAAIVKLYNLTEGSICSFILVSKLLNPRFMEFLTEKNRLNAALFLMSGQELCQKRQDISQKLLFCYDLLAAQAQLSPNLVENAAQLKQLLEIKEKPLAWEQCESVLQVSLKAVEFLLVKELSSFVVFLSPRKKEKFIPGVTDFFNNKNLGSPKATVHKFPRNLENPDNVATLEMLTTELQNTDTKTEENKSSSMTYGSSKEES